MTINIEINLPIALQIIGTLYFVYKCKKVKK